MIEAKNEIVVYQPNETIQATRKDFFLVRHEGARQVKRNKISPSDIAMFNMQYGGLSVRTSKNFHDRFLIIDDKELYLIGASLKDLGWKCFAFTKLAAAEIPSLKARV